MNVRLHNVRLKVPDISDNQVWVQSSLNATHKLVRGLKEDFSFTDTDLVLVSNRGSDLCTLEIIALSDAGDLMAASNRRATFPLWKDQRVKVLMKAGEVITLRCVAMREKQTGVEVRPGHAVVL
jgi:hypothetical protein